MTLVTLFSSLKNAPDYDPIAVYITLEVKKSSLPLFLTILTTVMTCIFVDKSTDNAKRHSICFITTISTSKKNAFFFQSANGKGIA